MKQRKFKLNPAAIAAILAMASPLIINPAQADTAAAPTATPSNGNNAAPAKNKVEIAHDATADKPAATSGIKNARATRAALHSASTDQGAARQALRQRATRPQR